MRVRVHHIEDLGLLLGSSMRQGSHDVAWLPVKESRVQGSHEEVAEGTAAVAAAGVNPDIIDFCHNGMYMTGLVSYKEREIGSFLNCRYRTILYDINSQRRIFFYSKYGERRATR